jgi:hypothetical protein
LGYRISDLLGKGRGTGGILIWDVGFGIYYVGTRDGWDDAEGIALGGTDGTMP